MSNSLQVKTIVITGAARRVGAHVARVLHAHGANMVVHYRGSNRDAETLRADLERSRANSVALVQADLVDTAALARIAQTAMERFGRIDALINNASSFYPTPVAKASERDWDELMGSNLKGPFFLAQACAPHLRASRGCIVNIVDIYGERPLKLHPIYSMAKAGLIMMTKSLARELAPEVRVNAIAPGTIMWPERELGDELKESIIERTPQRRSGSPDDIARTMLFLIRDADYITGQILAVDGGRSLVL